jgi:L-iditol 2-dehydrogenase
MGFDYPGAYAELVVVPPIGLKNLFRIPKALSAAHATFADPLSDVICGHKDLGITLDETVVVVGAGPIGAAHAALARLQGAGLVMLLERASSRLALVESVLGRERISYVDVSVGDGLATIREATDEVGADVVIVACSNPEAQQQALEMAAPRGRVLFFGGLPKGTTHIPFESNVLHYREVQVHGSYASRHKDQVLALEMLEQNAADLRDLISETVPLESTADVFARIRSGEVLKVVVEP